MSNLSRSRTRKFLYQMLYARFFNEVDKASFKESFFSWVFESNLDENYLEKMYQIITTKDSFMVYIIRKYAPKFDLFDMKLSYVLPIFIWVRELFFFEEEIPVKVILNERVEIAKIYWDDGSKKMVNWVMHNVVKDFDLLRKELEWFDMNNNDKFFKK